MGTATREQQQLQGIKLYSYPPNFSFFFSFKMKMSYLFLIIAGVIALGAVTAAREIEIAKRDIAAPEEDESKSLAEDPAGESGEAGEASSQAQLTQQRAAGMPPGMMIGSEMVRPAVQQLPCATCDDCEYKDWCHCSCESGAMVREEGNN